MNRGKSPFLRSMLNLLRRQALVLRALRDDDSREGDGGDGGAGVCRTRTCMRQMPALPHPMFPVPSHRVMPS